MTSPAAPPHEHDLPMALLLIDGQGRVQFADPTVQRMLQREAADCEGRHVSELLPHPSLAAALAQARDPTHTSTRLRVSLARPLPAVLVTVHPVRALPTSSLTALLVVADDDVRAQGEVRAASQFRATLESVISGFAHEVRNPIAAILSLTEAALFQLPQGSAVHPLLERIPGLVSRVDKLIKQSLRYSRPRPPQRSRQPLRALIEWSVEMAQMRTGSVQLLIDLPSSDLHVLVDAEQIEQVLVNLLVNAREAARSTVRLGARRVTSTSGRSIVHVEVSDDGPGVDEAHRNGIFEPFYTTKANGTGLGLAIARDLARLNGGDLALLPSASPGATFSLQLEAAPTP